MFKSLYKIVHAVTDDIHSTACAAFLSGLEGRYNVSIRETFSRQPFCCQHVAVSAATTLSQRLFGVFDLW